MRTIFLFLVLSCPLALFAQNNSLEEAIHKSDSLESRKEYASAIAVWKNYKPNTKLTSAYFNYLHFSKNKTAINSLEKAAQSLKLIKNRNASETELLLKIYTAHYTFLSEKKEAKKPLEKALEGYHTKDFKQAKTATQIQYLFDISSLYREYNPFEAVSFGEKALQLCVKENGERSDEAANYYNLIGDLYVESYNPTKASSYYQKAIVILEKLNQNNPENTDKLLTSYRNFIRTLLDYGDRDTAKKFNQKQNTLFFKQFKKNKNRTIATYFHSRKMLIHSNVVLNAALGNFKKATQYCDSLKAETPYIKENSDDVMFSVMRYFDVLDYTYEYENYPETIERCHQLEKTITQFDLAFAKMLINAKLGTSYEKLKNYEKALHHINIADAVVDKEGFNSSKFSIQIIKAMILSGMNQNQEAIAIGKKTLEQIVFEKTKTKINLDQLKFNDVEELADTYFINIFEKVADLYLNEYETTKKQKSLETAEKLYLISGKLFQKFYIKGEFNDFLSYYHLEISEGLLQCLLLKNSTFEQKLSLLNTIENNASQHLIKEYDKKVKRSSLAKTDIHQQRIAIQLELDYYLQQQSSDPKETVFYKNKIENLQSKVKQLTKKIVETEKNFTLFNSAKFDLKTTLSHLKPNQQLIKYYVCRQYVYVASFTNGTITIKKLASREKVRQQLSDFMSEINQIQTNYKEISAQLNAELLPFNLEENITIIPDSFLNYLPFEALFNPKTKQYTIENHLISYDYSLPMWELHQKSNTTKNKQKLAAFSPLYSSATSAGRRSDFKDLKYAVIESQKIVSLFEGTLFAKEKATKANFIKEKENFAIFHFSMHSQLFEDDFNKSCLLFSNSEKLFFSDLYGMNIPASMVALSACETGSGSLKNGEGIMSMSRALAYAGVKSAVVSLWKVPDRETSEIMILFYENLKKGQTKDEALAKAKIVFMKRNPMKNHPFYWAGFIVNGDLSPVFNVYYWLLYLGIGLGIIFLFFLLLRKYRKTVK